MENNNENNGNTNWTAPVNSGMGPEIPNATASLVLGIAGLFLSLCASCAPVGFILSILAFSKGKKAANMYESNPGEYSESSFKHAKAGKIIGIIGIVLGGIIIAFFLLYIAIFGVAIFSSYYENNH